MIKRFIIAIVLLGVVGGGLVWFNFFRDRMIGEFFANRPVPAMVVSTVEAQPSVWRPAINAIGTVNASQGVDLTVETNGVVKEILFTSNQSVAAGDVLLRLDDDVQRADFEAARTQSELDTVSLERTRDLQTRGVATNVSLDAAQAAAQASEARMERARAILEQRQLVAPFSGTIGIPRVDLGQYVMSNVVVATLQDIETMRVDFTLPEQQLPNIAIGQPLHVRIEGVERDFDGVITGIDPRVDPASRMVSVRGAIENADNGLTPGQFVRIAVDLPEEPAVIALPQTAVVSSLYGDFVYVVRPSEDDAERLEARQAFVQIGRRSGALVELRGGVEAGDRIVSVGQNRLSNGSPVTLDNAAGATDAPGPEASAQ
ncbi:MAG: efflux RND transporter periplasmic adaptor subunit [Microvirga sp.]|nr:efflux RND transporter periplasmic adaptor subunit [Microvirga sp.]